MLRSLTGSFYKQASVLPGQFFSLRCNSSTGEVAESSRIAADPKEQERHDKLFQKIELEVRGHDEAVLGSYTKFVMFACRCLDVRSNHVGLPKRYVRWILCTQRAKFAKAKYKLHYETRTYIKKLDIHNVTGSTASTLLEYIERNIPEGVGMKVSYTELRPLPETITGQSVWKFPDSMQL